nr:hypothetical protein [Tanacetum cinerariifolium]
SVFGNVIDTAQDGHHLRLQGQHIGPQAQQHLPRYLRANTPADVLVGFAGEERRIGLGPIVGDGITQQHHPRPAGGGWWQLLIGSGLQPIAVGGGSHALGAGANELREVPDVVVRVGVNELARARVGDDGREAVVAHVVGAAFLVEQHVPVGPAHGAGVEIVYHGVAVALA